MTQDRSTLVEDDTARARALRSREYLARRDYLREIRRLSASRTQTELAAALGVKQPTISGLLRTAAEVEDVLDGFSGSTPHEIARRYAAGEIDRDQLIDELARYPYDVAPDDDVARDPKAQYFDEVVRAARGHLIDEEACARIARDLPRV